MNIIPNMNMIDEALYLFNTPIFIFDMNVFAENVRKAKKEVSKIKFELATKSIGSVDVIAEAINYVNGLMFCCEYEYSRYASLLNENVFFSVWGAGKSQKFFNFLASQKNQRIVIDSISEFKRLQKVLKSNREINGITFRISPVCDNSAYKRFGISLNEAIDCIKKLQDFNVHQIGLAYHADYEVENVTEWITPRNELFDAIELIQEFVNGKTHIDLGGGISSTVGYANNWKNYYGFDLEKFHGDVYSSIGRAFVSTAGYIVTEILEIKKQKNDYYIIVDAGANILIPLDTAKFGIFSNASGERIPCTVADGVFSFGTISAHALVPKNVKKGDHICITNSGGYTWSMACDRVAKPATGLIRISEKFKKILK